MAGTAAMLAGAPAGAGPGLYDMSRLLAEPHPFAVSAAPPPVPRMPRPGGAGRVYDMSRALNAPHPFDVPAAPARNITQRPAAPPPPAAAEATLLAFAIGVYDINDNEGAGEFRLEWRGRAWRWRLRPLAGVMASSDAAIYAYGGLAADFDLGRRVVLTPSLAAGLYQDGGGKDLGSVIEFRSAIELAWKFDGGARLGLMFYHLSNAGLSDNNPGTEVLSLGYAVPLN